MTDAPQPNEQHGDRVPGDRITGARTRTQRLDALPFTPEHRRLLLGSGVGWALDAMDVGLVSFILAQLAVTWSATPGELSWIASAGFVGMAIGASLGGLLADRIGRRSVFALTLLVYGVATGASALSWSVGSLLVLRFVVGLGLGAELPVASTLVSEFAPPRIRGRIIVLLEAFWAVGWTVAAVIGYLVVPAGDNGWRWALALGAVPALYAAVVRIGLPESVRFLEAKGRHAEAERTVRRFELSAEQVAAPPRPLRKRPCRHRPRPPRRRRPGSAPCGRPAAPAHGCALAGLVLRQLLLLRRLHLVADTAGGRRLLAGPLVRLHAGDHAGAAARIRGGGRPGRDLGAAAHPGRLPGRLGRRGGDLRRCVDA